MNKVTKALKLVNGLTEEERKEFAEYFKPDEEVDGTVENKPEEKQVEIKEQPKAKEEKSEPKVENDEVKELLKLVQGLNQKIENIEKAQPKLASFGAQPKQGEGKETDDFNTIFENLSRRQG